MALTIVSDYYLAYYVFVNRGILKFFLFVTLFYLGKCYYKLGQYDKAIMHLYESYKINDNDNRIKFFIGLSHKDLEEYADAAKFFKKILKINPEDISEIFNSTKWR